VVGEQQYTAEHCPTSTLSRLQTEDIEIDGMRGNTERERLVIDSPRTAATNLTAHLKSHGTHKHTNLGTASYSLYGGQSTQPTRAQTNGQLEDRRCRKKNECIRSPEFAYE